MEKVTLDLIVYDHFNQPGYTAYRNFECLLLKATQCENCSMEYKFVTDFYGDDFITIHLIKILWYMYCTPWFKES